MSVQLSEAPQESGFSAQRPENRGRSISDPSDNQVPTEKKKTADPVSSEEPEVPLPMKNGNVAEADEVVRQGLPGFQEDQEAGQAALNGPAKPAEQAPVEESSEDKIAHLERELTKERQARNQEKAAREEAERKNRELEKTVAEQRKQIEALESRVAEQAEVIRGLRADLDKVNNETIPGLEARIATLKAQLPKDRGETEMVEPEEEPEAPVSMGLAPTGEGAPPESASTEEAEEIDSTEALGAGGQGESIGADSAEPAEQSGGRRKIKFGIKEFRRAVREQWQRRPSGSEPPGNPISEDRVKEILSQVENWPAGQSLEDQQWQDLRQALAGGQINWLQLPPNLRRALTEPQGSQPPRVTGAMLRDWAARPGPREASSDADQEKTFRLSRRELLRERRYLKLQDKLRRRLPAAYRVPKGKKLGEKLVGGKRLSEKLKEWRDTINENGELTASQVAALVIYGVVDVRKLPDKYQEVLKESEKWGEPFENHELQVYQDWRKERDLERQGKKIPAWLQRITKRQLKRIGGV